MLALYSKVCLSTSRMVVLQLNGLFLRPPLSLFRLSAPPFYDSLTISRPSPPRAPFSPSSFIRYFPTASTHLPSSTRMKKLSSILIAKILMVPRTEMPLEVALAMVSQLRGTLPLQPPPQHRSPKDLNMNTNTNSKEIHLKRLLFQHLGKMTVDATKVHGAVETGRTWRKESLQGCGRAKMVLPH
jgi:hypothetical protein